MERYEIVCDQLDQLALRNLGLSNDLIRLKLDLDSRLREGWLALAKTRFVAGFHRIGSVNLHQCGELADTAVTDYGPRLVVDLDHQQLLGETELSKEASPFTKFGVRLNVDESGDQEKAKADMERQLLKRFGSLAPPSVRQGQRQFGIVLEIVSEIATVESELMSVVKEYKRLLDLKAKYDTEG